MVAQAKKEKCKTSEGLNRQANKSTEVWMGKLRIAATECNYKEMIGSQKIILYMG